MFFLHLYIILKIKNNFLLSTLFFPKICLLLNVFTGLDVVLFLGCHDYMERWRMPCLQYLHIGLGIALYIVIILLLNCPVWANCSTRRVSFVLSIFSFYPAVEDYPNELVSWSSDYMCKIFYFRSLTTI